MSVSWYRRLDIVKRIEFVMYRPAATTRACEGKQVGDSVEFTGRRGETLKATCKEMNGQLAAVPEGGPPEGGRK